MENIKENRIRFAMMYWGQEVVRVISGGYRVPTGSLLKVDDSYPSIVRVDRMARQKRTILELKSAAFISDEDAITVARVAAPQMFIKHETGHKVYQHDGWVSVTHPKNELCVDIHQEGFTVICDEEFIESGGYHFHANSFEASRKLQELGYYVGTGLEVEYGWVKLIGGENEN